MRIHTHSPSRTHAQPCAGAQDYCESAVVILHASTDGTHALQIWRRASQLLLAYPGVDGNAAESVLVLDYTALAGELRRDMGVDDLSTVSKPVAKMLQKLLLRNATFVACGPSCQLLLKLLRNTARGLCPSIRHVVLIDPGETG